MYKKSKISEKKKRRYFNKTASIAYFQILTLGIAIFAFCFLIAFPLNSEEVSGFETGDKISYGDSTYEFKDGRFYNINNPKESYPSSTVQSWIDAGNTVVADGQVKTNPEQTLPLAISRTPFKIGGKYFLEGVGEGILESKGEKYVLKLSDGTVEEISQENLKKLKLIQSPEVDGVVGGVESDKKSFNLWGGQGFFNNLVQGVGWGLAVYGLIKWLGPYVTDDKTLVNSLSVAAGTGIFAGKLTYGILTQKTRAGTTIAKNLVTKGGKVGGWLGNNPTMTASVVGIVTAVVVFLLLYKKESKKLVTFECFPWNPPLGGEHCEECNDFLHECSEYRCKSLGQACGLVNEGTEFEQCVWLNPHDVNGPIISPWEDALSVGYEYVDVRERPPGAGMRMQKQGGDCIPFFTPIGFGITTNEPTQCKIDYNHTALYDDMDFYFGETNLFMYNHSQRLNLPGPNATESLEIENDGTFTMYLRCMDGNGNVNEDEFAIRFCVDDGPDTTPPLILATSIENGMPVQYNADNVPLEVYLNEPAECRWSREDKKYDDMESSMSCATNTWEMGSDMMYTCSTQLTGIKNREENYFYFRCKDQPHALENDRNVNARSFRFTVKGTQPLNIIEISPNETIRSQTTIAAAFIQVKTDNGFSDGDALCYYSTTGKAGDYLLFAETGTNEHSQRQDLIEGDYTYYVKCVDLGGNQDTNQTSFTVEIDKDNPKIVRAYYDKASLKIVTNEESECSYNTETCNFNVDEGKPMAHESTSRLQESFADWNTEQTYYIKCKDDYGNEPLPTQCSIIVKPYDLIIEDDYYE